MKKLKLALSGINHKTSTLEEREVFQLNRGDVIDFLQLMSTFKEIDSIAILNTCNRIEFYMIIDETANPRELIARAYKIKNISVDKYSHIFYEFYNEAVTTHLFRVISGLESMVLGEYQIQGQVKEAYSTACEVATVNKMMHKLFHAAFRIGKTVRNKTEIAEGRTSVSGVAAQIIIDNLNKDNFIAIIGVNENTKIISEKLKYNSFKNLIYINRTKYKAEMLANQFGGKAYSLDEVNEALKYVDAIYTSTGSKEPILISNQINQIYENYKKLKLIIDMAVPRDIEISNLNKYIQYYDIDDLKQHLEEQNRIRQKAVPKAEQFIEDEVQIFQEWSENQENFILEPYLEKFEIQRQEVLDEYKKFFSDENFKKVDKLTKSLVHRLQATFTRALIKTNEEIKIIKQHRDSM